MSDYAKYKVLRYPITDEDYDRIEDMRDYIGYNRIKGCGYFETTWTDANKYLDYVLDYSYGDDCGEYGKCRELSKYEQDSFRHLFAQFFPDIDMSLVHLVEYCWYNCCEPPDYYGPETDPFYQTIPFPRAVWIEPYVGVPNKYVKCSKCDNEVDNDEHLLDRDYCPYCGATIDKQQ